MIDVHAKILLYIYTQSSSWMLDCFIYLKLMYEVLPLDFYVLMFSFLRTKGKAPININ